MRCKTKLKSLYHMQITLVLSTDIFNRKKIKCRQLLFLPWTLFWKQKFNSSLTLRTRFKWLWSYLSISMPQKIMQNINCFSRSVKTGKHNWAFSACQWHHKQCTWIMLPLCFDQKRHSAVAIVILQTNGIS